LATTSWIDPCTWAIPDDKGTVDRLVQLLVVADLGPLDVEPQCVGHLGREVVLRLAEQEELPRYSEAVHSGVLGGGEQHGPGDGGERPGGHQPGQEVVALGLVDMDQAEEGDPDVVGEPGQWFQGPADVGVLVGVERLPDRPDEGVEEDQGDVVVFADQP
jgi:hypothetical protein